MPKILIADDEPDIIEAARERLSQNIPIDWDKIRLELSQGARRKAVERLTESGFHSARRPPTDRSLKPPTDRQVTAGGDSSAGLPVTG